jgi:hypothetical protein
LWLEHHVSDLLPAVSVEQRGRHLGIEKFWEDNLDPKTLAQKKGD